MYQYPLQDDVDRIPSIYINIKAGDWLIPSTDGRKFIGEGLTKRKKKKKKKKTEERGHFRLEDRTVFMEYPHQ